MRTAAARDRLKPIDLPLFLAVLTLMGIGLVMVLSASSVEALAVFKNPYYFFERQSIWAVLGLIGLFFASRLDYHRWRILALPGFGATLILLTMVLVPGIGRNVNGARRWIGLGPLTLQPSEVLKFALILLFAYTLSRSRSLSPRTILVHLGFLGVSLGLVMLQPDLGTSIAVGVTAVAMLYAAGMRPLHLVLLGAASIPVVFALIFSEPYRKTRFLAFLNPWKDPLGSGHQIIQGLYALGSGGLLGVGLGESRLKYFYLPEQHTDFIFSIIAEETGFLGASVVIMLFLLSFKK